MYQKIQKIGIKYEKIIVLLFIVIGVTAFSFNISLEVNDELFNFSNIYKMTNGYMIYKDLNVIITPLFFYMGKLIFKIFRANFFIFRIYNVIIFSIFYFLIYEIFRTLGIKNKRSIIYLIITYMLTYKLIIVGASYNTLAITFCLLGILLILRKKANWLQGLIIFLIFMTKQNIGIYYALGYITYILTQYKTIKETTKKLLPVGIIAMSLIGMYLLYLWISQNLYHFINYTFLGIREFGSANIIIDTSICTIISAILLYLVMIWILKSKKIKIDENIKKQSETLICFAIPSLLIAYPIVDYYHVNLAIILTIIVVIYLIEKSFLEDLTKSKKISSCINIIIVLFMIGIILINCYESAIYYQAMKIYDYYEIYNGARIDEKSKEEINQITNYIEQTEKEGKETIILSCYSNICMNIVNKNHGKLDLPFKGNLGEKGEDGIIEEIKNMENVNLLLPKEHLAYQESKKVRQYIMDTYEKIGELGRFFIYKIGY